MTSAIFRSIFGTSLDLMDRRKRQTLRPPPRPRPAGILVGGGDRRRCAVLLPGRVLDVSTSTSWRPRHAPGRRLYVQHRLKALGGIGKPVLLKRGFMATVEELLLSAEYILAHGNEAVVLCERGIRTFEPWTRNTLDVASVPLLKGETTLPVIVDLSHALGRKDIMLPCGRAVLAAGADGLMVEVHDHPDQALSDGFQQLDLAGFDELVAGLGLDRPAPGP
jgi:hypothetical protein